MNIRKILLKIYCKVQSIIIPKLRYSQYIYEDVLKHQVKPYIKWLDIGCGHHILSTWRLKEEEKLVGKDKIIVGLDYCLQSLRHHKTISLRTRGDITSLPFKDNIFNLIKANMVVEHLTDPDAQFQEINRVLKHGGIFLFHTPNLFGYTKILERLVPNIFKKKIIYILQKRKEEDIFDTYYKANTRKRIIELAKKTGFQVVKLRMIVSNAQFAVIPPLAVIELIWIRILMIEFFKPLRTLLHYSENNNTHKLVV